MDDLAKQIRGIQLFLVVTCLAIIVASITDTTTKQERAYSQLRDFRSAVEKWEANREDIRSGVYSELLNDQHFREVIGSITKQVSPAELTAFAEEIDPSSEEAGIVTEFLSHWSGVARDDGWLVLRKPVKLSGREVDALIIVDPVGCVGGQHPVQRKRDIELFWDDISEPNVCYMFSGFSEDIEFKEIAPQFQFNVLGALAHDNVTLVAGSGARLIDLKKPSQPHGSGFDIPTVLFLAIIGAGDGPDGYLVSRVQIETAVAATFIEIEREPLLRNFGALDPDSRWVSGGVEENFPDLISIISDYPGNIEVGDLDEIMRLNAENEVEELNALGVQIPDTAVTLIGLPLLAASLLYFIAHVGRMRDLLSDSGALQTTVWIGMYPGWYSRLLFIASIALLPVSTAAGRTAISFYRTEQDHVVAIAALSSLVVACAAFRIIRLQQSIQRLINRSPG